MNPNIKKIVYEYLWSSTITFVLAFGTALSSVGAVPMDKAALFAVVVTAARAGVRAVINLIASGGSTVSSLPQ